MMVKTRSFPKYNYRAVWCNGKTLRFQHDDSKPILELEYPEFYDVKITDYCKGGCPWCYQDSTKRGLHYENCVEKINQFFGPMTANQRPFQVAIGGGEPTSHPDFENILKAFHDLGICPNFTTNGMFGEEVYQWASDYCGGVAISTHPQLDKHWKKAVTGFYYDDMVTNLHIIISDKESVNRFRSIYEGYHDLVSYFVFLPHMAMGRGKEKVIEWDYLCETLKAVGASKSIAFGANFYPYLLKTPDRFKMSIYEPEILSKYLVLEDDGSIYKSSFSHQPIQTGIFDEHTSKSTTCIT